MELRSGKHLSFSAKYAARKSSLTKYIITGFLLICLSGCASTRDIKSYTSPSDVPCALWDRQLSRSLTDFSIPLPTVSLDSEKIGVKENVYGTFDRWMFEEGLMPGRYRSYADVTCECKGLVEKDFALTPEEWMEAGRRTVYYKAVDSLIAKTGSELINDLGNMLEIEEKEVFIRALKTLAWQETAWQHYLRYKDWFFVLTSRGSFNKLEDWGITQLARSSFDLKTLANREFFDRRGYCSISRSLYYGFMIYYFCYIKARENPENSKSLRHKIFGAYNLYSSGFSSSYRGISPEANMRDYQLKALKAFEKKFSEKSWEVYMQ